MRAAAQKNILAALDNFMLVLLFCASVFPHSEFKAERSCCSVIQHRDIAQVLRKNTSGNPQNVSNGCDKKVTELLPFDPQTRL
jgi:hypothetical protein